MMHPALPEVAATQTDFSPDGLRERDTIWEAWFHVKANQGAAGIDTGDDRAIRDEARSEPVQALESDEFRQLHSTAR